MSTAKKGDPVNFPTYPHEVLAVVLSVRDGRLCVLLWKRARSPYRGRWSLPGGGVERTERLRDAITGHLAAKVDVRDVAHLEQLATHSAIDRDPRARVLATAYLGLVPSDVQPKLPSDTQWHCVDELPPTAFDHHFFIDAAVARLRAKLSYTNIGFALAPLEFTIAELRDLFGAALGYELGATNLTRVLTRRHVIDPTERRASPGQSGGRPATVYKFAARELTVTDPFAVLRPPR
ncbi:NUDIX hydrolase [Kribbella sp. GL6]|uniref:NUDIX hydrolase n=1 Tax=Kribbella sp. GL6 TaxID=3419765 RepID=UPI003D033156